LFSVLNCTHSVRTFSEELESNVLNKRARIKWRRSDRIPIGAAGGARWFAAADGGDNLLRAFGEQ